MTGNRMGYVAIDDEGKEHRIDFDITENEAKDFWVGVMKMMGVLPQGFEGDPFASDGENAQ